MGISLATSSIAATPTDGTDDPNYEIDITGDGGIVITGDFDFDAGGEGDPYTIASTPSIGTFAIDENDGFWVYTLTASEREQVELSGASVQVEGGVADIDTISFVCFARATMIATPGGERAVETLAEGDEILTADGRTVAVKWMGRQTLTKVFTPASKFRPVRIAAGALGDSLPVRDLVVTKDHGMIVDGIVAHAGALVNGTTIVEVPAAELAEREVYYHIETEGHEAILANGAPAETFVDNISRRTFDNYAEYEARFGATDGGEMAEMDLPRVVSARQLPAATRRRLAAIAAERTVAAA